MARLYGAEDVRPSVQKQHDARPWRRRYEPRDRQSREPFSVPIHPFQGVRAVAPKDASAFSRARRRWQK
jgi:hypothetical protein